MKFTTTQIEKILIEILKSRHGAPSKSASFVLERSYLVEAYRNACSKKTSIDSEIAAQGLIESCFMFPDLNDSILEKYGV